MAFRKIPVCGVLEMKRLFLIANSIQHRGHGEEQTAGKNIWGHQTRPAGLSLLLRLFLCVLCGSILSSVSVAQTRDAQTTLIKNATVLTVSRGTLQNTDILIRNGKITAVGSNLSA